MIELLTTIGYSIVEASWHSAAVITKFYLAGTLIRLRSDLSWSSFEEILLAESRMVVAAILVIGATTLTIGWELRPFAPIVSEFIALAYLGLLFWRF